MATMIHGLITVGQSKHNKHSLYYTVHHTRVYVHALHYTYLQLSIKRKTMKQVGVKKLQTFRFLSEHDILIILVCKEENAVIIILEAAKLPVIRFYATFKSNYPTHPNLTHSPTGNKLMNVA